MRIAIIGAGESSLLAIEQAHKVGAEVVVVDDCLSAPGIAVADKHIEVAPSDTLKVIESLRDENLDLCIGEPESRYLIVVGAVNDAFHLPGISSQSAAYCSDKYSFHNRMRNRKLRGGHCYLINEHNPFDPYKMTYPAILKPRFGTGCRNVYYLNSPEDLIAVGRRLWKKSPVDEVKIEIVKPVTKNNSGINPPRIYGNLSKEEPQECTPKEDAQAFLMRIKRYMEESVRVVDEYAGDDEDYILENAFEGTEYGVDGVVEGCNFELVLIRRKTNTLSMNQVAVSHEVMLPQYEIRLTELINEYMSKATEVLGLKDCIIHADLIIQGRNVTAIEVSIGGALTHIYDELVPLATGIELYKDYFAYSEGESHNFFPLQMRKMCLYFFDMENCFVHKIPNIEDIKIPPKTKLRKWECNMKVLDFLGRVCDSKTLMSRGYYIIEGPDLKTIEEAKSIVLSSFEFK